MTGLLESLGTAAALILSLDADTYRVACRSLLISLGALSLAALCSIPLGLLVALGRFPGRALLRAALNLCMAVPTVVIGLFLYGLLARHGPLGGLSLLYTPVAIMLGQFVLILPLCWNLCITAITTADSRILQTCRTLGASRRQAWLVLLLETRFGLLAALITAFGRAISEVGISMILGGNIEGHTRTMTSAIALQTNRGEFEFALALGLLLLLTAMLVVALLHGLQGQQGAQR